MEKSDMKELLAQAYKEALKSHDKSTQNGAILVYEKARLPLYYVAACNNFPVGVKETPERWERPAKYKFVEHAERNVIFEAAKQGIETSGLSMVCCWAACSDCSRAIIQSGIKKLITHKQAYDKSPDKWKEEIGVAMEMLSEAGVEVEYYDGKVFDNGFKILHSGELWEP